MTLTTLTTITTLTPDKQLITMKILVLNCGSSSIKYALYNMDDKSVMTSGGAERVGLDGAFVKVKLPNGEKKL